MKTHPANKPWFITIWLSIGACSCMAAIIFSSLTTHLPDSSFVKGGRNMCRIADNILMFHGMALILVSILQKIWKPSFHFITIGAFFLLGNLLFCTGVFYIALTGNHPFLPIAPMGGSLLITGWLYLTVFALFLK